MRKRKPQTLCFTTYSMSSDNKMTTQTEMQFATRHAINIKGEVFTRIEQWLSDDQASIRLRAKCADDAVRTFTRTSDFVEYENESRRRIERLTIDASLHNDTATARITIGDSAGQSEFSKTAVVLRGSEEFCEYGRTFLKREIERWKPWYWALVPMPFGIAIAAVSFVLGLVLVGDSLNADFEAHGPGGKHQAMLTITVLVMTVIGGIFGSIVGRKLFPTVAFSIGDGIERYKNLDRLRYIAISIFATIVVAVAVA